jgi:hypothetical protein
MEPNLRESGGRITWVILEQSCWRLTSTLLEAISVLNCLPSSQRWSKRFIQELKGRSWEVEGHPAKLSPGAKTRPELCRLNLEPLRITLEPLKLYLDYCGSSWRCRGSTWRHRASLRRRGGYLGAVEAHPRAMESHPESLWLILEP